MKFEIGQEVIAIKDHLQGIYKKGDIFVIKDVSQAHCCGNIILDLGFKKKGDIIRCSECGKMYPYKSSRIRLLSSRNFIPIQKDSWKEVTFEQIKEPAFLCAN